MQSTLPPLRQRPANPTSGEARALAVVLRDEFDAPFRLYDAASAELVDTAGQAEYASAFSVEERALVRALATEDDPAVIILEEGAYLVGFPLGGSEPPKLVAVGMVRAVGKSRPDRAEERLRLAKWTRAVHTRLRGDRELRERRRAQSEQDRQAMVVWEAVMGLDRLHRSLRIDREPARNRRRILRIARELLGTQSLAWISPHSDGEVLVEGETLLSPWDCAQLAKHLENEAGGDESGYVLLNDVRHVDWGAAFPRVVSLLAVAVADKTSPGWVVALNKKRAGSGDGNPRGHTAGERCEPALASFRRSDAALLLPYASLLGLHVRGAQRYLSIKEILVGLTRALTAAIDAKDAYTYGHSERVAHAAVELGRELGLQDTEQNDIYLAGLLHDIGKIGVRDEILTKKEPLTPEEFKEVQKHPVIGHRILADLHAISHLLPGVLYHHELYDGSGYPAGLRGEEIPLLARILAVADSFDAMNTSRPYRAALGAERVDQILREGAGTQWDPLVIDAYFRCRDRLAAIRQRGLGESLRNALDGALRKGTGMSDRVSMERSIIG